MTQTYRTTDLGRWGTGKGSRLTPAEVDINFWDIIQRLVTLEADDSVVTIDFFEVNGSTFYVHLTDSTILGPYPLPVATYRYRAEWTPDTSYSVLDVFTKNGSLYQVLLDHISGATFDAGATDGSGNDLYGLLLSAPGNSLPTGGAAGQILGKSTSSDFAVTWRWLFPDGTGNTGKYLRQASGTQDDVEWATIDSSEIVFVPATASGLSSTNVEDALNEVGAAVSDLESTVASISVATTAELLDNTPDKVVGTDAFWESQEIVGLTDASTIAVDMSTFINASVTLGGSRTLGNPSNPKEGQRGFIRVVQDGTGSRALSFDSAYRFVGGTPPTLTTAAGSVDLLFYTVVNSNFIFIESKLNVF